MTSKLTITPLTTTVAARVEGVDMRQPIPPEHAEQIRQALADHLVLHFPDQHIGLEEQVRFAAVFGQPEPPPTFTFLGRDKDKVDVTIDADTINLGEHSLDWRKVDNQEWHTDSSFISYMPRAAILRAEVLSPVGGGTSWSSLCAAYDALSPGMQDWLMSLKAVHWYPEHYKAGMKFDTFPLEQQQRFDAEYPPREHPVVFEHPLSGRRGLFVNPGYTQYIVGLSPKESRTILRFLFSHIATSDFVFRHRWTMGDIMVWDELATVHLAPQDYRPHPRRLVRVLAGRLTPKAPAPPAKPARAGVPTPA